MLGIGSLAKRLFGSANDRTVKGYQSRVGAINALEPQIKALSDDELRAKTVEFRQRLDNGETVDKLLPEAFAVVREAAWRVLGQRHFDVQLIGGMVLNEGGIAEMRTGEGKTLVSTLAAYLNAVGGKGVHVVTVNDYLASRDSKWMGQIFNFLGLSVGCIIHGLTDEERRAAYACDITYGTNNEFGFDYLRDNMKFSLEAMVQRRFNFAIVDEVDSILIDEARTPLIISGPTEDNSELYRAVNAYIPELGDADIEKDEKAKTVVLTEEGTERMEQILKQAGLIEGGNLYDIENVSMVHHVNQALRAHKMFTRDVDYIVKDDKVVIIDEFTGRMMEGRRYSEGLHQALEAKEGVKIQNENQTLASITFQNYFRLYPKLSGMTGTASTEAAEFADIYNLGVVEIPTNLPVSRIDENDEVYRTAKEKYDAIIDQIEVCTKRDQPVLVGTVSIEKSEYLSELLKKRKITHNVLNARYHEQEAYIIAQAGRIGGVTIATNMAGRGTDIQLGGNIEMRIAAETANVADPAEKARLAASITEEMLAERAKVKAAGGLYVIGTERHESRRIDNQLRGRSGRQGDPGHSKFYLSLDDDLMRIFGSERMESMLVRLGLEEGEAITHPWINKALEKAQMKVEARNFDIRKNLLKYDDVMNDQRKAIYEQRRELMEAEDVSEHITDMRQDVIEDVVSTHIPPRSFPEQWNIEGLRVEFHRIFGIEAPLAEWLQEDGISEIEISERLTRMVDERTQERADRFGPDATRWLEKNMLLQTIDQQWKEHLLQLDHLRQTVTLRAYGQRDPLNEYKSEAFEMFQSMMGRVRTDTIGLLSQVELRMDEEPPPMEERVPPQRMHATHLDPQTGENEMDEIEFVNARQAFDKNDPSTWGRVPRNALCPCGSGQKYKRCHGALTNAQ
ncbi:preprotein translocase subunit SecA [Iodidimonas sp. SYSU 1G8]|uniref:preprotein translocase subunit SecA n=1 Tax=Iodidimonas sp. SYSU 1G8 TaxID=3133967 RepID=UPI0031FF11DD